MKLEILLSYLRSILLEDNTSKVYVKDIHNNLIPLTRDDIVYTSEYRVYIGNLGIMFDE